MGGWVTVMEPDEYAKWLRGQRIGRSPGGRRKFYSELACNTCHFPMARAAAPRLTESTVLG